MASYSGTEPESAIVDVLERFCSAFQARDAEAVLRLFAAEPGVVVVTSEEPLLRGHDELKEFLRAYVSGPTTYSWAWDRHDVTTTESVAWLLAEGIETADTGDGVEHHPYRMTIVCEKHDERWLLVHVHGSSPQVG